MRTSLLLPVLVGLSLVPAPVRAAPPDDRPITINITTSSLEPEELQAALEVLAQARASGVLTEQELSNLKGRLLGDRITLQASFNDAPLGSALLAVVERVSGTRVRVSVVIPQQDLPRLNERHVSARLNHSDPVATVRLLLEMVQEDEQGEWEVEYEESEGGTFVVRTHARGDDDDDRDDDDDDDDREELETPRRPEQPGRALPPPPVPTGPRPWLGVQMEPAPAGARGVRVSGLSPNGPAAQAGLRVGDVIVSLGGQPVASADDLVARLERTSPGQELVIEVQRADALMPVALRLKVGQRE